MVQDPRDLWPVSGTRSSSPVTRHVTVYNSPISTTFTRELGKVKASKYQKVGYPRDFQL